MSRRLLFADSRPGSGSTRLIDRTWRTELGQATNIVHDPTGGATAYNAFPGFCVTPDGHLLATWRSSTTHTSADGVIRASRTTDLTGRSGWSSPTTIFSPSSQDVRACTLTVLQSGTIIMVVWYAGGATYTIKSTNNGVSWTSPVQVTANYTSGSYFGQSPVVETNTANHLIVATYGANTGDTGDHIRLSQSTNGGSSWSDAGVLVPFLTDWEYSEPWITRLDDGSFIMTIRVIDNVGAQNMYSSFTSDPTGLSGWSAPVLALTYVNGLPTTFQTPDGDLVLMSRDADLASGDFAFMHVSNDRGVTWSPRYRIGEVLISGTLSTMEYAQFAYPGATGADGSLLAVVGWQYFDGGFVSDIYCMSFTKRPRVIVGPSAYGTLVLTNPDLVSCWPLNEMSGTTARDVAGGANPGTHSGGVSFNTHLGISGDSSTGTTYDGIDGQTDLGSATVLKPNVNATWYTVELLVIGAPNPNPFMMWVSDDLLLWVPSTGKLRAQDGTGSHIDDTVSFEFNALTHIAFTYDRAALTMHLFKNGTQLASGTYHEAAAHASNPGLSVAGADRFAGTLAWVAYYQSNLDASTILAHAQAAGVA